MILAYIHFRETGQRLVLGDIAVLDEPVEALGVEVGKRRLVDPSVEFEQCLERFEGLRRPELVVFVCKVARLNTWGGVQYARIGIVGGILPRRWWWC